MGYRRNAVDANQAQIVEDLRQLGLSVATTSQAGDGFPDIIVAYKGFNYMIEIKDGNKPPSQQKLTPKQRKFHSKWKGQIDVANSLDGVLKVIGMQ